MKQEVPRIAQAAFAGMYMEGRLDEAAKVLLDAVLENFNHISSFGVDYDSTLAQILALLHLIKEQDQQRLRNGLSSEMEKRPELQVSPDELKELLRWGLEIQFHDAEAAFAAAYLRLFNQMQDMVDAGKN